jgi:hypothetical protein
MRSMVAFLAGAFLALPLPGRAADDKEFPRPGSTVPKSFAPLVVNGNWKDAGDKPVDRYHSVVCEFGRRPVVLVFARDAKAKAVFDFLKKLEAKVVEHKDQDLSAAAVFVGPDDRRDDPKIEPKDLIDLVQERERLIQDLKERAAGAGLKRVLVAIEGPAKLKAFKVPTTAAVMVVLYRNFRVTRSFTLKAGELEKRTGQILEAVDKLATPPKETE